MHSTKNRIALAAASLFATGVLLAGCSTPGTPEEGGGEESYTIGFVNGGTTEFHTCLQKGVEAGADEDGVELLIANSQQDPAKEVANVEDMISRGVDAIIIQTVNIDALDGGIAKAKAAGIPVFVTNVLPGNTDDILGAVVTDVEEAGRLNAEWVSKDADGADVQAAIIAGAPGAASDLMAGGFSSGLDANVTVVANQPAMFQRAKAQEVAENIIQANPDLKYVFVAGEDMAFGASQAFQDAGKDVTIVTLNGSDEGLEAVENGTFAATVSTPAYTVGIDALRNTTGLLAGEEIQKISAVTVQLITKDNLDDAPPYCG